MQSRSMNMAQIASRTVNTNTVHALENEVQTLKTDKATNLP